mmetsp:Transcript_26732/g.61074  ORF Transcript_26732/g.61074 Transcript_26732/m.61074 type:complete len:207 (+) Transcript_26732:95-715(+)
MRFPFVIRVVAELAQLTMVARAFTTRQIAKMEYAHPTTTVVVRRTNRELGGGRHHVGQADLARSRLSANPQRDCGTPGVRCTGTDAARSRAHVVSFRHNSGQTRWRETTLALEVQKIEHRCILASALIAGYRTCIPRRSRAPRRLHARHAADVSATHITTPATCVARSDGGCISVLWPTPRIEHTGARTCGTRWRGCTHSVHTAAR